MDKSVYLQRKTLGILGALLPILCLIFGSLTKTTNFVFWYFTISATYYTAAITIFVGLLFAVGLFLINYRGYDWRDRLMNTISGISALGIAIFPNGATTLVNVGMFNLPVAISTILHGVFASIFFVSLAINILWLFTKTSGDMTEQKYKRNIIYKICGWGIFGFILIMILNLIFNLWGPLSLIAEAGMLLCFAAAWIIKGEVLFKDK